MSATDRFDRDLGTALADLADARYPDYFDEVLEGAVLRQQRPAWTFLNRWLPMVDLARQPVIARGTPLRAIGFGLLLLALILAAIAAFAGSPPTPPPPFGPARNGAVAYSSGGDIYVVDARAGRSVAVVSGADWDVHPTWSRDGTRLAFERKTASDARTGSLFVARPDGTGLSSVTPEPLYDIRSYSFSPGGRELLISARLNSAIGDRAILIAAVDGSDIRLLDVGIRAANPSWRPPLGAEVLFTNDGDDSNGWGGIYAIDALGGEPRTILEPAFDRFRGWPHWSPDGSRLSYMEWVSSDELTSRVHVIGADGRGDRVLPIPPNARWEAGRGWSNDGTRLLAIRGYTGGLDDSRAVARPVDGNDTGIEIDHPGAVEAGCCSSYEWSPDDSLILGTPVDASGRPLPQLLVDPVTGRSWTAPWGATSEPTWQRLAR
jgi:dipeptidyl aminopeptidase/acylaminoacyl peptidase